MTGELIGLASGGVITQKIVMSSNICKGVVKSNRGEQKVLLCNDFNALRLQSP